MSEFELFKTVIVGKFHNEAQIEEQKRNGTVTHPLAKHINAICNDKIEHLPADFKGIFVIEESYYTYLDKNTSTVLPHLFLFVETPEGQVQLISYEIPKDIKKSDFTNSNPNLRMNYEDLEVSKKFLPMTYQYTPGKGFLGESLSQFGPDTTFFLSETLSEDTFEVTEILKKGDRVLVGFDSPIIYKRE